MKQVVGLVAVIAAVWTLWHRHQEGALVFEREAQECAEKGGIMVTRHFWIGSGAAQAGLFGEARDCEIKSKQP